MILLCAATEFEILPTIDYVKDRNIPDIEILITGIGSPATMYSLCKHIAANKPDGIIQAGIAGTYKPDIAMGEVVVVEWEQWGDLGIEDHDAFHTLFDMRFADPNQKPYLNGRISCCFPKNFAIDKYRRVNAITCNTAHGNETGIQRIVQTFNPDIETMEGAAAAYVCAMENIPFLQIRSISNMVEPRCKERWNIPLAIENLNREMKLIIS